MTQQRLSTGACGEALAAEYLEGRGLKLLARNVRTKVGELDLVAKDGKTLVFVEVKTRRSRFFGAPQEAVGPRKQRQILRAALWYLATQGLGEPLMRFDVVSVLLCETPPLIEHFTDAFDGANL